jgi:hypothetical protein
MKQFDKIPFFEKEDGVFVLSWTREIGLNEKLSVKREK